MEPNGSGGKHSVIDRARPVVKICGFTRHEDVLAACDLGVWALGFVFAPSPRRVTPREARELVEKAGLGEAGEARDTDAGGSDSGTEDREKASRPLTVGVFVGVLVGAGFGVSIGVRLGASAVQVAVGVMGTGTGSRFPMMIPTSAATTNIRNTTANMNRLITTPSLH